MEVELYNFDNRVIGAVDLNCAVFGLKPRQDIIKLVINWQLAKARSGTHKTRTISLVSGTTRKPYKQKGTGRARQGSLRSVHMRGGGVVHGPVFRSHATSLPKKVRKLGLIHALSSKYIDKKLFIVDSFKFMDCTGLCHSCDMDRGDAALTSSLVKKLSLFNERSFCIIDASLNNSMVLASRNLQNVTLLPQIGANVYDILRRDCLLLSREAVIELTNRL